MRSEKQRAPQDEEKTFDQESPATSATAEVVRCSKLNIRKAPNPKAEIMEVLAEGTRVVVNLTAKFDKYYEILSPAGKKGYAMKTYLSFIE